MPEPLQIGEPISSSPLQRLRRWISNTGLQSGARLPPERTLAGNLSMSRSELRKALAILESRGGIERHVGRGTFLAEPQADVIDLEELTTRTAPHDAMVARIALEPELAHLAALHAAPRQVSRARDLAAEMRAAPAWDTYEALDHAFHAQIAEAAGNPLLYELHRITNAVRKVVVWRKLAPDQPAPPPDYHSFAEHDAIVSAISARDQAGARKAMRAHLRATLASMTTDD